VSEKNALALSVGVLGAVAVLLTGTLVQVPVWVVFIAWASFFILGGDPPGLVRSLASNLTGVAIAALTLLVAQSLQLGLALTAVAVGLGSAAMVQASRAGLLSATPAIVWGFASTVGTVAVTGRAVTEGSLGNPVLTAAVAVALGGVFGIASERLAAVLSARSGAPGIVAPKGEAA
jgi:Protein of unknown function (DUF1097)